jgi:hypothetical protein
VSLVGAQALDANIVLDLLRGLLWYFSLWPDHKWTRGPPTRPIGPINQQLSCAFGPNQSFLISFTIMYMNINYQVVACHVLWGWYNFSYFIIYT